ncbi:hypothetical protein BJD12_13330 [Xanthomonas vesicatoria ATCC 35937]|uniref:Uncharacterized protein n=1 Tax=Xanthomonas vesicatoria TaxID=56460 RepID=A0AAJ0IV90_9XANT|nr:hypothetical protein BI313_16330 [Xanthomonas vesicatoria]APP76049.1 hypothetical protein BJD12_13330 [Xanthomonas vesicatoria ATCC 35937]KHM91320.1 hypothetical protein OR61_19360 [Xanthomonas vesicatoria]KHM94355.1 hypothetical protein OR60_11205 [Xanthomonas vesicatoria]KTF34723.1 hypothetical protein LMG919_14555 [Xanthomonas vesicatoria]
MRVRVLNDFIESRPVVRARTCASVLCGAQWRPAVQAAGPRIAAIATPGACIAACKRVIA